MVIFDGKVLGIGQVIWIYHTEWSDPDKTKSEFRSTEIAKISSKADDLSEL
jgi:hypothetical protein